ncbi:MAG: AmmeMemoRadiSam system protein B [Treponema sp.]|nr:AmmeMemoRadiSam system protein B [Treponema sp.]
MQIREYSLPQGWFPRNPDDISGEISGYLKGFACPAADSLACLAPHAGWYYCGRLMALSCASLKKDVRTIAVIGGHLPANYPALFAMEDAARTPFGILPIDKELRYQLMNKIDSLSCGCAEDRYKDNTIEVLLPMVHYFFPEADLLWLRLPASLDAYEAGKLLSKTAKKLGKLIAVIGSTDLTHYGSNYGFSPHGSGEKALHWVRDNNDACFIKAVESGSPEEVLLCAEKDSSSCSAGAVLGAMGFAAAEGLNSAKLLEYTTSADVDKGRPPDSFVGYASMSFGG